MDPGETKSLDVKCSGDRKLIGGGYQRTTFVSNGGDRITESRAISSNTWRVTAHADQNFGGELGGIAYCLRSKKPLLRTVTATVPVASQEPGSVTTPSCPKGRVLGFTGFSTDSSDKLVYMGSSINSAGTTTASGFNDAAALSSPSNLTAYGYCLKV